MFLELIIYAILITSLVQCEFSWRKNALHDLHLEPYTAPLLSDEISEAPTLTEEEKLILSYDYPPTTPGQPADYQIPRSCVDAVQDADKSGVYLIHPNYPGSYPFYVYCEADPSGGSAWTIVQRRGDGSVSFDRLWRQYKNGFGNLYGEFLLGLDFLHVLTHTQPHELWIKMEGFREGKRTANYSRFAIGNEEQRYALYVLGMYSGDAGDSLSYHVGQSFSTKDRDNDNYKKKCVEFCYGAWWHDDCCYSNLNGFVNDTVGVFWKTWRPYTISNLRTSHMAIRPIRQH